MSNRLVPFPGTFDQREERTVMVPVARLVLRTTAGPLRGQQYTFDGGVFVIGRAPTCTISIPSQAVSRAHARIEYANGGYWIIPEKTVNGTRVNGNLVNEPTQLADKDKIAIDDSAFVVACRTPGEDLDFEDLASPPAVVAKGSHGPQHDAPPRSQPPYGRDSVTAMSAPAPAARPSLPAMQAPPMRPSMHEIPAPEPRYSAQTMTAQVAGQIDARAFPDRPSGMIPQSEPYRMPSQPGFAPPMYGAPPPYPYYPPAQPAPRSRAGIWFFAGIGVLALIAGVVVATVKLVAPPAATPSPVAGAPAPAVKQEPAPPPVVMKPTPATPTPTPPPTPPPTIEATRPEPAPPAAPPVEVALPEPTPTAPTASTTAVLAIETTPITSEQRGTVLDVARVGTAIKRDGGVSHVRMYSANFESAAAKLAALQKKYGTSEEYADFIAEAKQDYAAAARRREVKAIASDAPGTVMTVKVKPGDEVRANQIIAELAVARITVPVEAVQGKGKKCTAELPAKKSVKGTLLSVGSTERTIELDAVPKDIAAGELGDVKIHCP
ncbi:MAG: FHA domain-containing protein [Kofleriaceae bacterium]